MKLQLPQITPNDRKQYSSHTDLAIQGINLIKSLSVAQQKQLSTGRNNATRRAVMEVMGGDTNPSWITARAAQCLYESGTIDEKEFDRLAE